jgi:hypothetical protein
MSDKYFDTEHRIIVSARQVEEYTPFFDAIFGPHGSANAGEWKVSDACGMCIAVPDEDCRYRRRHGRWPKQFSGCGNDVVLSEVEHKYHGGYGSHLLGRPLKMDAINERHAQFLGEWLDGCTLSLK